MENLLTQISEKLNLPVSLLKTDLIAENLVKEYFIDEDMKDYFEEELYLIDSGKTYLYLFRNISARNSSTVIFEFFKAILNIRLKFQTNNIQFFLIEDDKILDFGTLLKSLPVSLEKYSPDFDYILSDFKDSTDENLKRTIKLKIFSEIIKYVYKDEELKSLLLLLIKNIEN